jgi:H+/Cl- antiporter ClcA
MKSFLRFFGVTLAILAVSLPLSFFVTILLVPLWRWVEATYQIESIGHSGPSDWCFWLVYTILVFAFMLGWWAIARKKNPS